MSQPGGERRLSGDPDTGLALLCHLAALSIYVGIPFGNILGPLVVWLLVRSRSAFVDDQGKEALNFQISFAIYAVALFVFAVVAFAGIFAGGRPLAAIGTVGFLILVAVVLAVFQLVFVIVAAIQAGGGTWYRYPFTIRLIR